MSSMFSRGHRVQWGVLLQEEGTLMLSPAATCWVNENTGWISAQSHAQSVHFLSNLAVMTSSSNNLLAWHSKLPRSLPASTSGPVPHLHHKQFCPATTLSAGLHMAHLHSWPLLHTHISCGIIPMPHLPSGGLLPACTLTADLWHRLAWGGGSSKVLSLLHSLLDIPDISESLIPSLGWTASSLMRSELQIWGRGPFQVYLPFGHGLCFLVTCQSEFNNVLY